MFDRDIKKLRANILTLAKFVPKANRYSKITHFENDQFKGDWIEPKEGHTDHTLLYFHGGGYIFATPKSHHLFLAVLCNKAKLRAFYLDYPLAPEHPFPAALESAYNAYKWLLSQEIDPKKIIIGGDSAGGGLALALLLYLKQKGDPLPNRAVCISPYVDLTPEVVYPEQIFKKDIILRKIIQTISPDLYAAKYDRHNPLISPLLGDFTGAPPILLFTGTAESFIKEDLELAQRLKQQGVDVKVVIGEDMFHDWPVLLPTGVRESKEAIHEINTFINSAKR